VALPGRVGNRLTLAGALVAALFFMHGGSATGCPGGDAMATVSSTTTTGVHPPASGSVGSDPMAHDAGSLTVAGLGLGRGHDQLCVSTPPRPGVAVLLALSLLLLGGADATRPRFGFPGPAGRRRGRAPPLHGAALLLRHCVSRT